MTDNKTRRFRAIIDVRWPSSDIDVNTYEFKPWEPKNHVEALQQGVPRLDDSDDYSLRLIEFEEIDNEADNFCCP